MMSMIIGLMIEFYQFSTSSISLLINSCFQIHVPVRTPKIYDGIRMIEFWSNIETSSNTS